VFINYFVSLINNRNKGHNHQLMNRKIEVTMIIKT